MKAAGDDFLFVYGTLRRGPGHPMHHVLSAFAELVGDATFQGRLYRVASYPGAVSSPDPRDRVQGELYRLHYPSRAFAYLDEYEGYEPSDPEATLFLRARREVKRPSGEALIAWIYLYNRSVEGLARIGSGDFLSPSP